GARERESDTGRTSGNAAPPARHVVALGKRKEFDSHFFSAGHLEKARRMVAVKRNIGDGEIMDHDQFVFLGKLYDSLEELQFHNCRGRIMWKANDEQLGFRPSRLDSFFELSKEPFAGSGGNTTKVAAGENYRVLMDRIGWTGAKYSVT